MVRLIHGMIVFNHEKLYEENIPFVAVPSSQIVLAALYKSFPLEEDC